MIECAFCHCEQDAVYDIGGDPACLACREAWEAEADECADCGELYPADEMHGSGDGRHPNDPDHDDRAWCDKCFATRDPEREAYLREAAAEARAVDRWERDHEGGE